MQERQKREEYHEDLILIHDQLQLWEVKNISVNNKEMMYIYKDRMNRIQ